MSKKNRPIMLDNVKDLKTAKELLVSCLDIIDQQALQIEQQAKQINALTATVQRQMQENEEQAKKIIQLEERISVLEKNSSNSSKPPSSDIVKPINEQRQKGIRKIGGQKRHKGNHRVLLSEEEIDHHEQLKLEVCPDCGSSVVVSMDRKSKINQVAELVVKPIQITQYTREACYCMKCCTYHYASLPSGIQEQQICGSRLQSYIAYEKGVHGASYKEIQDMLKDVFDFDISTGGIANIIRNVSSMLNPAYKELAGVVKHKELLHIDETGWKDKGSDYWVWLCCDKEMAYFHIDKSRGSKVLRELLGDNFSGSIISDFHSAYLSYANINQQFCLAHLIRDIKYLITLPHENVKAFGERLLSYFTNIFRIWHRKNEIPIEVLKKKLHRQVKMLRTFLDRDKDNSKLIDKMKRRLFKRWQFLFKFTEKPYLYEPTNNLAEQTLRIVTRIRKLTQGTRSSWGRLWCSVILSIVGTCRKKKISAFNFIAQAVNASYSKTN